MNDFVVKTKSMFDIDELPVHVDLNGVIPKLTFKDSMSL